MAILKLGNNNSEFSGSFSGSFEGDGSGLTGISSTPFPFTGDAQITGSLIVSSSKGTYTFSGSNATMSFNDGQSLQGLNIINEVNSSTNTHGAKIRLQHVNEGVDMYYNNGGGGGRYHDALNFISDTGFVFEANAQSGQGPFFDFYSDGVANDQTLRMFNTNGSPKGELRFYTNNGGSSNSMISVGQSTRGVYIRGGYSTNTLELGLTDYTSYSASMDMTLTSINIYSPVTGSTFSGSFVGDGSGLTNVPAGSTFPYTGSAIISGSTELIGPVNITGSLTVSGSDSIVNLQEIQFDTEHSASGHTTGRMYWSDDNKTVNLEMQGSDVVLQLGQEEHIYVKNTSGVTINNGDAVRINGAAGSNVTVTKAISSIKSFKDTVEQDQILGIATEQIDNNQSGYITTFGAVRGLNTSTFTAGDILYLSNTTSGSYSNTRPPAPYFEARVGVVEVSNATEGVILARPSEPIFLTDISQVTSSGVITNEKTYLCYDDSTDLINFTNEFSGSFSGSFEGSGTNLTDVPVTMTNTLWVSTTGDNSTAQKNNVQRPWLSIREALGAASSGDSVIVEPGTYIESPFTLSNGVTLKSLGGLKSATISASNNSANFITQEANTRLEGFTVTCPSGAFAGIFYDDEGTGTIYDVTLKGQGNSIGCQISQSTASTSKVIYNEIRYGGGNFDKLIYVQGGIFACDGIHVPGGGNIDKIFHTTAGRLQAINTNAGNPNVSSSFYNEGGTNVILGCNLFNVQEAFHLASQDYTINVMNAYVDDNVDKHITIDAGISGSDSSTFNIIAGHMQAAKISANPDWVSSNHAFSFQDDGVTLDPAFRTYSDLEVGHANKGFTTGMGEGLPYNKGMEIWASGSGGVSQSLTAAATSKEDSTFGFAYSASGDMMYFGNKQKDPTINDLYLYFTGLQYRQVTTGSLAFGDLTLEIFTTASTWEAIDGAQVVSSVEGYNYANNIFLHENSQEEIIANVKTDVWATSSIFNIEARWGRIRLLSSLTESPTFEQFLYTPDTTLINPKGIPSFRGKALFRDTLLAAGNVFGESGNVVDADITVGTGTSNPPQTWSHNFKNSLMNSNGDAIYLNLTIPKGTCTAFPLKIDLYYYSDAGGSNDVDMYISALPVQVAGVKINDPNGGKVPTARTVASTTAITADNAQVTTFTNIDNTTGIFHKITSDDIDISSYYEGDVILIRVELDNDGADNSDIAVVGIEASAVKWSLGERT